MGYGDNDELNVSDAELAADEAAVRGLLSRWGEPSPAPPPPALAAGVIATIEGRSARTPARRRRRTLAPTLTLLLLAPLFALGLWGVLGDSLGPAGLAGGPSAGLGQLLLGLTLAAKPLVNLLLGAGLAGLVAAVALVAAGALWWRLVRAPGAAMGAS
jgi:hypothetical protein